MSFRGKYSPLALNPKAIRVRGVHRPRTRRPPPRIPDHVVHHRLAKPSPEQRDAAVDRPFYASKSRTRSVRPRGREVDRYVMNPLFGFSPNQRSSSVSRDKRIVLF